jgi:hypothetical protein
MGMPAMKIIALGLLVLAAAPMLGRAWYLTGRGADGDSALRWLVGASLCLALASGLVR